MKALALCHVVRTMGIKWTILRPLTLPYVSPIVRVKNKDGSNRESVCVDFRKLDKITEEPMMIDDV